ncbi:hypothetical protein SAMN05660461_5046 [Chitinophaga ginsengisegetis]|uniref:Uncharacterized protein n=1 Tax=Chitinophaga ginsengisegetis TaxID=393003 RepID=A0A1T5P8S9_9BACT|nr:hypothetical protein SAMN05660461_5046 [Chitinophaga ginsengisegetis]
MDIKLATFKVNNCLPYTRSYFPSRDTSFIHICSFNKSSFISAATRRVII